MTHKLQEVEDAHIIAELRQRVASLEVQIQEFVTTGQLNDNEKNMYMYQQMSGSSISLADFSYDDVCIYRSISLKCLICKLFFYVFKQKENKTIAHVIEYFN